MNEHHFKKKSYSHLIYLYTYFALLLLNKENKFDKIISKILCVKVCSMYDERTLQNFHVLTMGNLGCGEQRKNILLRIKNALYY